jgi:hypothetical protein
LFVAKTASPILKKQLRVFSQYCEKHLYHSQNNMNTQLLQYFEKTRSEFSHRQLSVLFKEPTFVKGCKLPMVKIEEVGKQSADGYDQASRQVEHFENANKSANKSAAGKCEQECEPCDLTAVQPCTKLIYRMNATGGLACANAMQCTDCLKCHSEEIRCVLDECGSCDVEAVESKCGRSGPGSVSKESKEAARKCVEDEGCTECSGCL